MSIITETDKKVLHIKLKNNNNHSLLYLIFVIFIITEILDDFLDHVLGSSIIHSIIQLFLFIILFFIVAKIILGYFKRKIDKLIPEELMAILEIIKDAETKGVLINQRKVGNALNITKPTLKKRVDSLIELQYIFFEEKGNNRYLRLTKLGNSLTK